MSLKKKRQLLGFWSSLSHKPAEENTTQGQGQDELSTAKDAFTMQFMLKNQVARVIHFSVV